MTDIKEEDVVLQQNQRLLDSIAAGDYATYQQLCDPQLTCFEPESLGHLVEGLDFHKFYFTLPSPANAAPKPRPLNSMVRPKVVMLADTAAVVSYVRLQQVAKDSGPVTIRAEETRVWQKKGTPAQWVCVHFHKSTTNP